VDGTDGWEQGGGIDLRLGCGWKDEAENGRDARDDDREQCRQGARAQS
jgi:hypothetical protein